MPAITPITVRPAERQPMITAAPVNNAGAVAVAAADKSAPTRQPALSLKAPRDLSGNKTLPSLTLYSPNGASKTIMHKPSDMDKGQVAEAAKEAAGMNNNEPCRTCAERRYTDGSNDPGVSYKAPTKISPSRAASAVAAHEREHVTRNAADAKRDGRKVVASSVTLSTAMCPECGKSYVSGGTTRTTTVKDNKGVFAEELRGLMLDQAV